MTSPFQSAFGAVWQPLEAAIRSDGSGNEASGPDAGLDRTVVDAAERAAALRLLRDAREALGKVAARLREPVEDAARLSRLRRAAATLRPFSDPGWPEAALSRPASALPGVGPVRAAALEKRGLASVADLLFHLPLRYDDRRSLSRVGDLEVGRRATFVARVIVSDFTHRRGRGGRYRGRVFEAVVGDETGSVVLKWFRGGEAIADLARKDALLLVTGDVRRYRFDKELVHPEIRKLDEGAEGRGSLPRIVPDYAAPEGLHPRALRRHVQRAVAEYADLVEGHLPDALTAERGLPEPAAALVALHDPEPSADLAALRERRSAAHARLVLEELYLLELGLALRRSRRAAQAGIPLAGGGERVRAALAALPFALTGGQRRAWEEIAADLARPHPMNRLLQGDVGSGKTVLAYLAAVAAAECGFQTALMAPTELLAEQHARSLAGLLAGAGPGALRLALLTASAPGALEDRQAVARGEADLVVGTHALVQASVAFPRLGLAIVDEQQRFGVRQRAALAAKGEGGRAPHTLVMTATPIPRTLALTLYGDLDVSVIDELPPGRSPVRTLLFRAGQGERVAGLLRETVARKEQVYVVYPLVDESEKSDLRAASESAHRIARAFPDLRVDLVHGRLDAPARAAAMGRFERGETDVLVSTTVIEVGVDVPGATLMIVEHAERFGLAQLHQLRGRVGRGRRPGTCACVARAVTEDGEARLRALLATNDGFAIAEADLEIRGPGEFLGTRQHGHLPDLRIADLVRDARWISVAREAALATVRADPGLRGEPGLRRAVRTRWGERLALADVG